MPTHLPTLQLLVLVLQVLQVLLPPLVHEAGSCQPSCYNSSLVRGETSQNELRGWLVFGFCIRLKKKSFAFTISEQPVPTISQQPCGVDRTSQHLLRQVALSKWHVIAHLVTSMKTRSKFNFPKIKSWCLSILGCFDVIWWRLAASWWIMSHIV